MEGRKMCLIAWTIVIVVLTVDVCLSQVLTKTVTYNEQSLVYPSITSYYDNNVDCGWLLQTDTYDFVVHVTFTFVNIEEHDYCSYDYVQVFNGSSASDVSLGKLCGSSLGDFYSSGQSMYIKFHSDGSQTRRGFRLIYQAINRWNIPTTTDPITKILHGVSAILYPRRGLSSVTASVCSPNTQPLTALISTEQSLQYPANYLNYPDYVDCGWLLQTDTYDYVVHVTFTFVDTEYNYGCLYDYVEVYDGSSGYADSLGRLCGSTVRDFYSSGQSVYIKFHSDGSKTRNGFRLTYQAVPSSVAPKADSVSPAVIAGAVCGSIVFLMAVVMVIVSVRRRRLKKSTRNGSSNTSNNQNIAYFHPANGSASNGGPIFITSGPYHVTSVPPHVTSGPFSVTTGAPSAMPGPPSPTSAPPPYYLVCQPTGVSYPSAVVNGVHTLSSQVPENCQ